MDILIKILQLVLSLSILIVFHEFGHFLFAKLFKTRVEKFYMFFNPWFSLFKFKKGETEYGLGWLPLGGYVKIAGMIDESMDTEQMKKPAQPWEFRAKPAWQRLLIMLGGVMVNVVLAFVIYVMVLFVWGKTYLPVQNVKYGVVCEEVFQEMGMKNGDKIVSIDGQKVDDFYKIVSDIFLNNPKTIEVERDGQKIILDVPESLLPTLIRMSSSKDFRNQPLLITPRLLMDSLYIAVFDEYSPAYDAGIRKGDRILFVNGNSFRFYDEFTGLLDTLTNRKVETTVVRGRDTLVFNFNLRNDNKFGIGMGGKPFEFATKNYTLTEAVPAGIRRGVETLSSYLKQLKLIFTPESEAYKSVGGMMTIGSIFPGIWDWQVFWELTALISIMLAVLNILPIPALDGGHVLFLLYEVVTRRKPGEKFLEYAQIAGMFFLLGLFLLANINDIVRFFG